MQGIIQNITQSFASALNSNELVVFFISMLPIVEVRGGIPIGLNLGLTPAESFGYAILSGMVVVPIILFLLKKVIYWMCKSKIFGKFGKALDGYFYDKAKKVEEGKIVQNRKNAILKYLALYVFVAAPLPLTGFWTGSAVAVFLNLNPFISFFVIVLGNLTAGGLILAMSLLLGDNAIIITIIFLIFVPIVFAVLFYKLYKKRKQEKAEENATLSESAQCEITDKAETKSDVSGQTATESFSESDSINSDSINDEKVLQSDCDCEIDEGEKITPSEEVKNTTE